MDFSLRRAFPRPISSRRSECHDPPLDAPPRRRRDIEGFQENRGCSAGGGALKVEERFSTGSTSVGQSATELLNRFSLYFFGLPRNVRVAVLALFGLVFTFLAVPKFEEEFSTALVYMVLAVVLFWIAISEFM
jgi:hypothetical protein